MEFTKIEGSNFYVAELFYAAGAKVTAGKVVELRIFRIVSGGNWEMYDWAAATFKSAGIGDDEDTCSHKVIAGYNTGIWENDTAIDKDAFVVGNLYVFEFWNATDGEMVASPSLIQWGGNYGQLAITGDQMNLANNAISAAKITDGSFTNAKFADNFLTAAKIAANAFTNAKFADAFLTAAKIAANAITDAKINAGAFTSAKFANDFLTAAKIATNAFGADEISAGAVTKIQNGLATALALSTHDTEIKNLLGLLPAANAIVIIAALEANDNWKAIRSFCRGNVVITPTGERQFWNEANDAILFRFTPTATGRIVIAGGP